MHWRNELLGEVYPRVCGGSTNLNGADVANHGLSPRVRGIRGCSRQRRRAVGSIPACAGDP